MCLLIPSEPHVVAPEGCCSACPYLWEFYRVSDTVGLIPTALMGDTFFLSVTSSEYTKQSKRSSRGFSMNFLCARQSGPPEFQ